MKNKQIFLIALCTWCILFCAGTTLADDSFLSPKQAFKVFISKAPNRLVDLRIEIAEGYYLYRDQFQFSLASPSLPHATPVKVDLPPAHQQKFDENFGKLLEVYRDSLNIQFSLPEIDPLPLLTITYQGCADKGLCYSPMQAYLHPDVFISNESTRVAQALIREEVSLARLWAARDDAMALNALLSQLPWQHLLLGLLLVGVSLSFTPCVLPMLPIISAIVVGQKTGGGTRWRSFVLSLSYVLGMSVVYSLVGVLAALAGASMAVYLQNPWILGAVALILVWMAGSLFGWYELQMPAWVREPLHRVGSQQKGGNLLGAFVMGMLSALAVGPCMTAPLTGILLLIAHTGAPLLGAGLLFSLALGMGLPLILIAVGAGKLVPRSGPWMNRVKHVFGVLLFLLAVWVALPVLSFAYRSVTIAEHPVEQAPFVRVGSLAELRKILARTEKPVMLAFYADWCISCKEMERFTLNHPDVRKRLSQLVWLQIDVTDNTAENQALLHHFDLFGPPALLFFTPSDKEIPHFRVVGYQNVSRFQHSLDQARVGR